jgi:tetratricopeptide (TPR) repeat protein/regulation of enolase protein 1 (concanavalin A-like superfamily)
VCDNLTLEGRCVSIGQPISYWPFLDILRTYFNLSEGDDTATIARKVIDGTTQIFPRSTDETLPFLGNLLSIRFGNELDDRLKFATPEQIKHQTLMQLRDLFRTLAEKQPLLLILEDLHWADDFSLNLISLLMDELSHTPLMLLCIYRPDKEHQVSHLSDQAQRKCLDRYTELILKKLSTVESRQLVEELLTIDNLPESVKNMILNKSEGNPFFIEEVIRSLIDRDLVYRAEERWKAREGLSNIDVPDTIQSVILARVDRLQTEAKYVLQCASVIGRLFKYSLLEHLSKQERNLNRYLIEFEEKDLVYPEHTIPELEYAFKHALTQEATYQSILERKQKEFHLQIARGIEHLYHERLDEYYEELAQHYSKTDDAEKAVEYLLKAGEKAIRNYSNDNAISYFLEALNIIDEKGMIRGDWKLEAQKGLGELYILIGKSVEAEKVFHEAIVSGEKLKLSSRELVRLYAQVCEALHWQSRNDEAINYAEMGLNLLGDDTECVEAMLINYQIAVSSTGKGNVKEWGDRIQKDIAIVDKSEYSPELRNIYNAIAFYNCLDRDTEMSCNWYKKWEKLAIEHNDINSLASIYAGQGEFLEWKGDYINSIVLMQKALELYKRIGENKGLCYGPISIADKLLVLGDIELAESYYIQCVSFAEQINMLIYASHAYLGLGNIAMCRRDWEKAISFYQKATTPGWDRPRFTKLIRAFLRIGRYDEAILQFGGDDKDHKDPLPDFQVLGNLLESLPFMEEAYMLLNKSDEFLDLCHHLKERHANIIEMFSFHQWYLEKIEPSYSFPKLSSDNDSQFSNINSLWNWIDEFGDCSYNVRDDSNGVEIHSANGRNIHFNNNSAPRLLRQISKDFAVEVCISSVSEDKPQIGGLLIWKDSGNYVCFVKGIKGQDQYNFDGYSNNKLIINGRGLLPPSENDETYLRLERSGDEFTSYCSVDGENWFTCGKMTFPLEDPIQVGIHAIGMIDRTIYCGEYKEGTATLFRNFRIWK